METTKNAPKKGTQKTEVFIGQGVVKLQSALKNLDESIKAFEQLPKTLEDLSFKIADKEQLLKDLDVQYGEKKRQSQVELELAMKEHEKELISNWLRSQNMLAVKVDEYNNLQAELAETKQNADAAIKREVAIVTNRLTKDNEATLLIKEAEFKAKEASNIATINSLKIELEAARKESTRWESALTEERKAGIERAKASTIGNINIPTDSRR